ncbi:MAG: hypothetical protein AAGB93_21755 [Planctomycetota bacterium]
MSRRRPPRSDRARRLREAQRVQRTRLGIAVGVLSIVAGGIGALLTKGSIETVATEFGVLAFRSPMTGGLPPFLLTYIAAGCSIVGGIGLLLPHTFGWWTALGGAALGLADLGRLYVGLFGSIDPNHPRASEVTAELLGIVGVPAFVFVALVALLVQRPVRVTYRVSRDDGRDADLEPLLEPGD